MKMISQIFDKKGFVEQKLGFLLVQLRELS